MAADVGIADPIVAAGGLLIREAEPEQELAVIHRARYGEWGLPKGKPKSGESLTQTALREVQEETGFEARITGFAGAIHYLVGTTPKVVTFWTMEPVGESSFSASEEVDSVDWLTPAAAIDRVEHKEEKELIERTLL
jgi:8-oxo-dGTP diphosphatase